MNNDKSEPRKWEILLDKNSNKAIVAHPGEVKYWTTGIYVIEKSAYDKLAEENARLKFDLDAHKNICAQYSELVEGRKENARLKAELVGKATIEHNFREVQVDRERLIAELEQANIQLSMSPRTKTYIGMAEDINNLTAELKRAVHQWQQASVEWGKEKHKLEVLAESYRAKLQEIREFFDNDINNLPCTARQREMSEDIWSEAMWLRDQIDILFKGNK